MLFFRPALCPFDCSTRQQTSASTICSPQDLNGYSNVLAAKEADGSRSDRLSLSRTGESRACDSFHSSNRRLLHPEPPESYVAHDKKNWNRVGTQLPVAVYRERGYYMLVMICCGSCAGRSSTSAVRHVFRLCSTCF